MFLGSGIWCCGGGDWSRQWNYVNWGYQKPVPLADPKFKTGSWVELSGAGHLEAGMVWEAGRGEQKIRAASKPPVHVRLTYALRSHL